MKSRLLSIITVLFLISCTNPVSPIVDGKEPNKISARSAAIDGTTIILYGNPELTLNAGDVYSEPGAIAIKHTGEITTVTNITTDINTSIPNVWHVVYSFDNTSKVRKVIVKPGIDTTVYPTWDATAHWTTYTVGDRKISDNKLYECKSVDYSYIKPSSQYGYYGWFLIRNLK